MKLVSSDEAWANYLCWQKQDKRMAEWINSLIRQTQRYPFSGFGKREAMKLALSNFWLRRKTNDRRKACRAEGDDLLIVRCYD